MTEFEFGFADDDYSQEGDPPDDLPPFDIMAWWDWTPWFEAEPTAEERRRPQ